MNKFNKINEKKIRGIKLLAVSLAAVCALCSCSGAQTQGQSETTTSTEEPATRTVTADASVFNPYATENVYKLGSDILEKQDSVDYGKVLEDVKYYSETAGDYKQCNILLPAGYNEKRSYPVVYVLHGWGGNHSNQISKDSYLTVLYGNMLTRGICKPMIIVNVDMYTDKAADKGSKTDEELRVIYDRVIDDIPNDLMPFIEENYAVKQGRENTAVAGASQGGSEALAAGFKSLDKFAYIGSFAPDPGVIPTEFYKDTFWNTPIFQEFPKPAAETTPKYLYLAVGTKDQWNVEVTEYYRDVLNTMEINNQTDIVEGFEHNAEFWQLCYYNFLNKIFK